MAKITHYSERKGNTQRELQRLAKDILAHGKIESAIHHGKTAKHPNEESFWVNDGGICFAAESETVPVKYWVHVSGYRIVEIIEELEA